MSLLPEVLQELLLIGKQQVIKNIMIKVIYKNESVIGYYSNSDIIRTSAVINKEEKLLTNADGTFPYIEISEEEHMEGIQKEKMVVKDGVYQEYVKTNDELLQGKKDELISKIKTLRAERMNDRRFLNVGGEDYSLDSSNDGIDIKTVLCLKYHEAMFAGLQDSDIVFAGLTVKKYDGVNKITLDEKVDVDLTLEELRNFKNHTELRLAEIHSLYRTAEIIIKSSNSIEELDTKTGELKQYNYVDNSWQVVNVDLDFVVSKLEKISHPYDNN